MDSKVSASSATSAESTHWPVGKTAAWSAFIITFLLGFFDLVDRQILAALFPYIKAEWNLSDTQLGSLVTIVNVAIALLVVPSGILVDRWSRKKVLGTMAIVWSLATAACALAGNFFHLFLARFFIGAGEAGYGPASSSLIAAVFPKRWRTFALGASSIGCSLGAPIGLIIGAYVATHWGWRHAFGVVALPGLLLAIVAFFLKDYKTISVKDGPECPESNAAAAKAAEEADCVPPKKVGMLDMFKTLLKTPTLLAVYFGTAFTVFYSGIIMNWLPSYFNRMAGMPMTEASGYSAMAMVVCMIGTGLIGLPADWLRRHTKMYNATTVLQAVAISFGTICYLTAFIFLEPGSMWQIIAIMGGQLGLGVMTPLTYTTIMDVVHPGERATAVSLQVLWQNIFGFCLGPLVAGAVSDMSNLGDALTMLALVPILGGICCIIGCVKYRRDLDKAVKLDVSF